jgi:hypothetical protein
VDPNRQPYLFFHSSALPALHAIVASTPAPPAHHPFTNFLEFGIEPNPNESNFNFIPVLKTFTLS